MRLAVFIERDGLLNAAHVEHDLPVGPRSLSEFRPLKDASPLLQSCKEAGLLTIATTNQPGISRGQLSRRELELMNDQLMKLFPLDDIMVCPHDEDDQCPCRKPNPGLLIEAGFKWHIDLDRSFVVSDKWQDAQAARVAGCTSIMISSPWSGKGHHDCLVPSFQEGISQILKLVKGNGVVSA